MNAALHPVNPPDPAPAAAAPPWRPVLRYFGGKWMIAPWIIGQFPPHVAYIEAFGGGASVLMRKPRARCEVYNDLDGEVVNVFRVLQDRVTAGELERLLKVTPFARAEFELSYDPADDPVEQARRTIIRSSMARGSDARTGTRSGFRSASHRGGGQHPACDWANYPDSIPSFVERLAGVVIERREATEVLRSHDGPNALHYVDPPYPLSTRNVESTPRPDRGYRHELRDDGHRGLAAVLRALQGMVILSGYPCELYDRELYPDWKRVVRPAHADGGRERTEVLWMNEPAASRHAEPELRL